MTASTPPLGSTVVRGQGAAGTDGLARQYRRYPTIADLRERAKRRVPRFTFDFVDAGCGDDLALRANREAFDQVKIVPRYGFGTVAPDCSVSLFGRSYAQPFGVSPMGFGEMIWPGSERVIAAAAQACRVPYVLATPACASIEEIAPLAPDVFWFQLYAAPADDYAISIDLARRAGDAGAHALIVTMDVPVRGKRPKDMRNGLSSYLKLDLSTIVDLLGAPNWAVRTALHGLPRCRSCIAYTEGGRTSPREVAAAVQRHIRGGFDWGFVRRLREIWKGPLVIKGILSVADAEKAVAIGADGLLVSNHGGRVLDASCSPLDVLPEIRAAVGERIRILLDSGVRGGLDIVRGLALGADLVMAGRPFLYGTAALGERGGDHVMTIFSDELRLSLAQLGCRNLDDVKRLDIRRARAV